MKYFSEKTNKTYDSEAECREAEEKYEDEQKKLEIAEAENKALISKQKKELADKITLSDEKVDTAYKEYEEARAKASDIIKEANKQAEDILKEAARKVEKATEERMNNICEFNEKFGTYTRTYKGDSAIREYNRIIRKIRDSFPFFWF